MLNRSLFALVALALSAPVFAGCESFGAVSLGKGEGIPAIQGSTAINIPQDFKCGTTIEDPNKKYTVTTTGSQDSCTFRFAQDVTVIKAADYDTKPELKGARFIESVKFEVNKFAVRDGATDMPLDPATTLKDLTGTAFATTILTKADIGQKLPFEKSVEGAPIDALKTQVEKKQDIIVPVVVIVVVALTPNPPAQIALDFDAQPNIIVSALEI